MFSGVSFKSVSFNPVSFNGLGYGVLTSAEWVVRCRRRRRA